MGMKPYPYEPPTREEYLTTKYGECVNKKTAATILGKSPSSIPEMLRDGRLEAVCEGKKVSVASIARYMDMPAAENFKARLRRRGQNPRMYIIP